MITLIYDFQAITQNLNMAPLYATSAFRRLAIPRSLVDDLKSESFTEPIVRSAKRAIVAAGPEIAKLSAQNLLLRRSLTANSTQKVTLGVIAAYAVVIALLWNLPYVRWSLWPFKVSSKLGSNNSGAGLIHYDRCLLLLSTNLGTR